MLFKEALLDAASVGLLRRDGPAKVRIPVKVCLLVTIPVPFDGVLPISNNVIKKFKIKLQSGTFKNLTNLQYPFELKFALLHLKPVLPTRESLPEFSFLVLE